MKKLLVTITMLLFAGVYLMAQNKPGISKRKQLDEFMDMRFGMFIHWGPVTLRGTEIGWSRGGQVPTAEYDQLFKEFNPVLFDADAWVKTAKDAGMKYLTITARHHDGFCLWPSAFTEYDIAATPYKKDIVGALQVACKKQGIKFCIYYSLLDWYHPDYPIHLPDQAPDPKSNMNRYLAYVKNQLKELLTQYDPFMLWFDGGWETPWTDSLGRDMYKYLKDIKPNVIINDRLGKIITATGNKLTDHSNMVGDYFTPEQAVGKLNMETPWESCFTMGNQWSWKPNDKIKSLKNCLDILAGTSGGNGNLLFNIGPMPDGRMEARQVKRLQEMGTWLNSYGESVYQTKGGPWQPTKAFAATRKGNKIYLHLLSTEDSTLILPALPNQKIIKAYLLKGASVIFRLNETGSIVLELSDTLKKELAPVIVLEIAGDAATIPVIN